MNDLSTTGGAADLSLATQAANGVAESARRRPWTAWTTHPLIGVAAVLVGSIVTTLSARITSVGIADIRGAIGASVDDAAWITTAFTVAQMLIGPVAAWLARVGSTRRVLLWGAVVFAVAEALIPIAPNLPVLIALQFAAGLGSGVFIPVTIAFIVMNLPPRYWTLGLAAYAMNLQLSLNIAATLEGWYDRHFDWRWMFWQNAALALLMIVLIVGGVPRARFDGSEGRRGDYVGMILAPVGFGLLFAALDQGDRLDWFQSDLVTALVAAGLVFLATFFFHEARSKRRGLDFAFLAQRNMIQIVLLIAIVRFLITGSGYLVPQFLTLVDGHRPDQFGNALLWVALPQFLLTPLVAWLLLRFDARALLAAGLLVMAWGFLRSQQLTSAWNESDFIPSELTQALGQTVFLTAIVFYAIQHFRPVDAMNFGAFLQTARLFGGEVGTAFIQVYSRCAEQTDSNLLGVHLSSSDPDTLARLRSIAEGIASGVQGGAVDSIASVLLDRSLRAQAFTLAYGDCLRLCLFVALASLLIVLTLRKPPAPE